MENTSLTLLNRLRNSNDDDAWHRLFSLYQPLVIVWLRKYEVQSADADDLAQDVLMTVSKTITSFDHNGRPGAFRNWLQAILEDWKATVQASGIPDFGLSASRITLT